MAHPRRRREPAAARVVPRRARHPHARARGGLGGVERLGVAARQGVSLDARVRRLERRAARLQQPLRLPDDGAGVQQRRVGRRGQQRGGAQRARVRAVVGRHAAVEQATGVARGLGRRLGVAVEHRARPALGRECPCGRGAGQTTADDHRFGRCAAPGRARALRHEAWREACDRHLALAAETRRALHLEAGRGKAFAQRSGDAPRRRRRPGHRATGELLQQRGVPHHRVAIGCEAVEVEGVGVEHELRQPLCDVAEREAQHHAPVVERERVQVGRRRRPGGDERRRERRQRRRRVRTREVVARGRVLVDRDEPQPLAALAVVAPRGPGREEVVAEPEAGLEHDEARAPLPARGQPVAAEEDVARLPERAGARVVDVAEVGRERRLAGGAERDARRRDWREPHVTPWRAGAATPAAARARRRARGRRARRRSCSRSRRAPPPRVRACRAPSQAGASARGS